MEAIVGAIVGLCLGLMVGVLFRLSGEVARLRRDIARIARHLNVDLSAPTGLSERVKELARDPARKIEAIKLHRDESGASLAEAKKEIEDYVRSRDH